MATSCSASIWPNACSPVYGKYMFSWLGNHASRAPMRPRPRAFSPSVNARKKKLGTPATASRVIRSFYLLLSLFVLSTRFRNYITQELSARFWQAKSLIRLSGHAISHAILLYLHTCMYDSHMCIWVKLAWIFAISYTLTVTSTYDWRKTLQKPSTMHQGCKKLEQFLTFTTW